MTTKIRVCYCEVCRPYKPVGVCAPMQPIGWCIKCGLPETEEQYLKYKYSIELVPKHLRGEE